MVEYQRLHTAGNVINCTVELVITVTTGVGEDDTDLLKVPDVAKKLNVGVATVWRIIGSGELESVRVGARSRRVSPAAVEAYKKKRASRGRADDDAKSSASAA